MFLLLHNSSNNFPCNFCLSWKRPVCSVRRDASSFPRGLILTFSQKLSSKSLEKSFVSTTEKMLLSPPGRVSSLLFPDHEQISGWISSARCRVNHTKRRACDFRAVAGPAQAQHRAGASHEPREPQGRSLVTPTWLWVRSSEAEFESPAQHSYTRTK